MVSTIKVSPYLCLKYVQLVRKTVACLRNNNNKPIDIYHDQDGTSLVEWSWKCSMYGKNNNKLRGFRAQSVHPIESCEEEIQDDV